MEAVQILIIEDRPIRVGSAWLKTQTILAQLAVQGVAPDTERLGGQADVAAVPPHRCLDVPPLDILQAFGRLFP